MAEIADVVASETITVEWGNAIRDRTIQRYNDLTTRDTENPTPTGGDLSFLENTGDIDIYFSGSWRHIGSPVGTVEMQAGGAIPPGWLLCNGQAVSRTTYAALYAYLGDTWGAGDGSTTFNVPDLRQKFPLGVAASGTGNALGATGGSIDHRHTGPSHAHPVDPPITLSGGPTGLTLAQAWTSGGVVSVGSSGHGHNTDIANFNTGAGGTGNTGTANPPFAALHFRIKT